jgi:succinate-semialdehyde dehydrogenase/glutarate-semialdehyde dehydrogenase
MATRPALTLLRSKAWVGGNWVSAANGATFPVRNPSTGEKIADVADLGVGDTEAAIDEAHRAQGSWASVLAKVRDTYLKVQFALKPYSGVLWVMFWS